MTVLHMNCLDGLRVLGDNSVDSIVTDPPYGLSFMGKKWDYDVPSVEIWAECLRVLKPGGHLLAFAGTRTQHRMAVRIEDAGFEIRDMIAWVYASGMPKSFNLDRLSGDKICGCSEPYTHNGTEEKPKCNVRPMRDADVPKAKLAQEECRKVLQPSVQEQGSSTSGREELSGSEIRRGQSCVEGRRNASSPEGELCSGSVCESAPGRVDHGAQGRICDGAPLGNGEVDRTHAASDGSCASRRPRSDEQCPGKSGAMAGQSKPQAMGAWPVCGGCGLPRVPSGLGTALKPALEPITVARKPLVGTVAANVLQHGTGALNIDGCRVPAEKATGWGGGGSALYEGGLSRDGGEARLQDSGRWPANLIHDGSDEVLAGFPESKAGGSVSGKEPSKTGTANCYGEYDRVPFSGHNDTGSAARFFYCAKASKSDRGEGNNHPTVKPTDLMRYLCRLVTPPGGLVLDPFTGSGSTGKAAKLEGFQFIGFELSEEYVAIARARIDEAVK